MSISSQLNLLLTNKKNIKKAIEERLEVDNITERLSLWPDLIASIGTQEEVDVEDYNPTLDEYTHIFFIPQNITTVYSFLINPTGETTIDWGDGTDPDTLTETGILFVSHVYSALPTASTTNNGVGAVTYTVVEIKIHSTSEYTLVGRGSSTGTDLTATTYRCFNNMVTFILEVIPATNCLFGMYCFHSCYNIKNVKLSPIQTELNYTFPACYSLTNLNCVNSNITALEDHSFANCYSLTKVTIPSNVARIGIYCFLNTYALKKITIPETVTYIGKYAFNNCVALEEVYWNSTQQYINSSCFSACYNLKILDLTSATAVFKFGTSASTTGTYSYINAHPSLHIVVPKDLYNTWKTKTTWRYFWAYLYWRDDNGVLHNTDPDTYTEEEEIVDNVVKISGENVKFNDVSTTAYPLTDENIINWLNSTINE